MANNLEGVVQTEVEINASADDYFAIFKSTPHHISKAAGDHIQEVLMHGEDDWDTHDHGSIKVWNYTVGVSETLKERVEVDEEKKSVTLVGLEGDPMKVYKVFNPTNRVVPKDKGSLVILSIQYEKLNDDVPPPNKYLNMMTHITKDLDAHLCKPN